tara:strand:+ start:397 stop:645 length:249 start_codon:yes stop_codon:yes gene_type:complete
MSKVIERDLNKSEEEVAHDAIQEMLNAMIALASSSKLSTPHVLSLLLSWSMHQTFLCAPDREDAERLISDVLKDTRKEVNDG